VARRMRSSPPLSSVHRSMNDGWRNPSRRIWTG